MMVCGTAGAQGLRMWDFRCQTSDRTALRELTSRPDMDGGLCALLKIDTRETGWSFDAGLSGIMDVQYHDGEIWLYLPASVRSLSVSSRKYGSLRDWSFPQTLEPGRTYSVKLGPRESRAEKVSQPRMAPAHRPIFTDTDGDRLFCTHFIDASIGLNLGNSDYDSPDPFMGLQYTYLSRRVGPYVTLAFDSSADPAIFLGAACRIFTPDQSDVDWQFYGGLGLVGGHNVGLDIGTRLAWKSERSVSGLDFGIGCQIWKGAVMPTLNVGLYIWGVPVAIGVGLLCSVL